MRRNALQKFLLSLSFFAAVLIVALTAKTPNVTAVTNCPQCDPTYQSCASAAMTAYNDCINGGQHPQTYCEEVRDWQLDICIGSYQSCLASCNVTFPPGSSGASGTCGKGRTPCEQSCSAGRQQCVAEGGTDCGTQYQDCMIGCCP